MNCQSFSRFDRIARNSRRVRARPRKCCWSGAFVVGVAGREHHALDAQLHHLVEERAHALGIGAVEQRGVGGHAEAALQRFADAVDRDLVAAFAADGEIVVLLLAVQVDAEGQVLARLEEVDLFLQQQRVGAEVDVLLARHQAFDDLVDLRVHQRLAAGDGDHRGAALVHRPEALLGGELRFRMWAGYWILPQPAQARLQRNSGSSISTSGYCFRRASFCRMT